MKGMDSQNFETFFGLGKSYVLLYIVLVITIIIGPKIGDF